MTPYCVAYVTAPAGRVAKKLASEILKSRAAACVNIIPKVASSYWWKGKIESATESLLIIKMRRALVRKLETVVRNHHPYTVPEIITLPIDAGHAPYLRWIADET